MEQGDVERIVLASMELINNTRIDHLNQTLEKVTDSIQKITNSLENLSNSYHNLRNEVAEQKTIYLTGSPSKLDSSQDGLLNSTRLDGHKKEDKIMPPVRPVIVNQINPDPFSNDGTKAKQWYEDYNTKMNINGYTDEEKFQRIRAYLKGEAADWFDITKMEETDFTWANLKPKFLKYFCGMDTRHIAEQKLNSVKQAKHEHPTKYLVRILKLCHEFDNNMSNSEKTRRIMNGLLPQFRNCLLSNKNKRDWTISWLKETLEDMTIDQQLKQESIRMEHQTNDVIRKKSDKLVPRNLDTWLCFNCDNTGHVIDNCPKPLNEDNIAKSKANFAAKRINKQVKQYQDSSNMNTAINSMKGSSQCYNLPCMDIKKDIITIKIDGYSVTGRVDSGSDFTVLPKHLADKLKLKIIPWEYGAPKTVSGSFNPHGTATGLCIFKYKVRPLMILIGDLNNEVLFGIDFIEAFQYNKSQKDKIQSVTNINSISNESSLKNQSVYAIKIEQSGESLRKCQDMLAEFADVFSKHDLDIGRTTTLKHKMKLTTDVPIAKSRYSIAPRLKPLFEQTINQMLGAGILRNSISPYATPVFFVDKDGGQSKRLVADYRAINDVTITDESPLPTADELFEILSGMNIFAKFDITSMYNQIEMEPEDIEKTAITTHLGLFEYTVMPFGLKNAPRTATRLMREVLRHLNGKICYVYVDDIIIFAKDIDELIQRSRNILERIRMHKLKLKPSKCIFGAESIKFLGHIISGNGIAMDKSRFDKILSFPRPKNTEAVQRFHGLCNYNRKYIANFADIAKPLTPLMGKPSDFKWTQDAQDAFEKLKQALVSPPILVHFSLDGELELRTDASNYAIGAVLYQKHTDPKLTGVILYYSKTLNKHQQNYSATGRELFAAYHCIIELSHYLIGKKFTLVTDHSALSLLKSHKDPQKKLARWVAELQEFEFDVVHRSGKLHIDADFMSRIESENNTVKTSINNLIALESSDLTQDDLRNRMIDEQTSDPFCKEILHELRPTNNPTSKQLKIKSKYTMQNELLYKLYHNERLLLVIPRSRIESVLNGAHDVDTAAHLGFSRTFSIIKSRYFWPNMRSAVKKYVASCDKCQRRKARNVKAQGFIKPLPIAYNAFDVIGLDLMTKLPISESKYNSVMVCTDNLSKFAITVPLTNEKSETITKAFFRHVIAKFGCPVSVLTDRGANLLSPHAKEFFESFGIERKMTSSYHPQTNGQTERFNRTLAASLTHYVNKDQSNWSEYLDAVTFAYNATEHSVTQVTPYEIIFGKQARIPLDNHLCREEFIDKNQQSSDFRTQAKLNVIRNCISRSQKANKERIDKFRTKPTFKLGDLVLFERPTRLKGQVEKFSYIRTGPYRIKRRLSELSFELEAIEGCTDKLVTRVAHPMSLIAYNPRVKPTNDSDTLPVIEEEIHKVPPSQQIVSQDESFKSLASTNYSEDEIVRVRS